MIKRKSFQGYQKFLICEKYQITRIHIQVAKQQKPMGSKFEFELGSKFENGF